MELGWIETVAIKLFAIGVIVEWVFGGLAVLLVGFIFWERWSASHPSVRAKRWGVGWFNAAAQRVLQVITLTARFFKLSFQVRVLRLKVADLERQRRNLLLILSNREKSLNEVEK